MHARTWSYKYIKWTAESVPVQSIDTEDEEIQEELGKLEAELLKAWNFVRFRRIAANHYSGWILQRYP